MFKNLTFTILFFSIAQPSIIFPLFEKIRIFFILTAFAIILFFFQRKTDDSSSVTLPQNRYIIGMLFAYTLSEAQFFWLPGTITVFTFWLKKIILYFLFLSAVKDEKDLIRAIWFVLIACVVLTILGWEMFIFEPELLHNKGRLQSLGNYNLSNSFALVLATAIPLVFALLEISKNFFIKILLLALIIAFIITAAYTKSRGGCLGLFSGIILYVFTSRGALASKPIKVLIIAISMVAFVGYVVPTVLTRSDVGSYAGDDASGEDRLLAWQIAIEMFIDHPIAGVGWQKYIENVRDYGHDKKILSHNTILNVLAETGIIGFYCFIWILYLIFKQLIQSRQKLISRGGNKKLLILTQGILISFTCFMINTSFSVKDHDPIFWMLLSFSGSVTLICKRKLDNDKYEDSP